MPRRDALEGDSLSRLKGRFRSLVIVVTLVALAAGGLRADLVYFKRGGQAQIAVRREGSKILLGSTPEPLPFESSDFRKIVPGDDPPAEWAARLERARKSGADECFAAVWWGLENGLATKVVPLLDESRLRHPDHASLAALARSLARVTPSRDDPEVADTLAALGGTFHEARSPHFLLIHQGTDPEALERLALLEDVYTTYYLTFVTQGIDLGPPRRRLVAATFSRHADYLDFLRREHARSFSTTQGYYHPTRNIVVSFDPSDLPEQRKSHVVLDERRKELARVEAAIAVMPPNARLRVQTEGDPAKPMTRVAATAWLDAQRRDLARLTLLLDLDRRSIDVGVAAHEVVHQLVANSGLAPHHDDFPIWLHEGLAAQFEVVRGGRWAGVGRAHDLRLPDWRAIAPGPRLAPIVRDEGYGQGYRRDLYAEAWALVYYLRKERSEEFVRFLDLLRAPSDHPTDPPTRWLRAFRSAFGDDLAPIEGRWHRFMRSVHTPLETGADS